LIGLLCKETRIRAGQPKLAEVLCEAGHFSQLAGGVLAKATLLGCSPQSQLENKLLKINGLDASFSFF
jgi:hypothetical protein